jgi:hypothetical protein
MLCVKALGASLQNHNTTECKQHEVYKFFQDILVTQPVLLSHIGIVIGKVQDCSTDRIIGNSRLIHNKKCFQQTLAPGTCVLNKQQQIITAATTKTNNNNNNKNNNNYNNGSSNNK